MIWLVQQSYFNLVKCGQEQHIVKLCSDITLIYMKQQCCNESDVGTSLVLCRDRFHGHGRVFCALFCYDCLVALRPYSSHILRRRNRIQIVRNVTQGTWMAIFNELIDLHKCLWYLRPWFFFVLPTVAPIFSSCEILHSRIKSKSIAVLTDYLQKSNARAWRISNI